MREEKELVCITCPLGCHITVTMEDSSVVEVKGNTCPRGDAYARSECTHPVRMLTSTVKIHNGIYGRLPVITSGPIPKDKMCEVMKEIHGVVVQAPIKNKDVIIHNVLGLGVDIIASRSMEKE